MNIKLANKIHTNSKLSGKAKFIALTILTLSLLSNQASYAAESRGEKSDITHFTKMAKQGRHNEINHMIKKQSETTSTCAAFESEDRGGNLELLWRFGSQF